MTLNDYARECRKAADRWYHDPKTGLPREINKGERCMLIVSEVSEAFEGLRKDKMDDHLPHRKSVEVELVDALIRIFDFAGEEGFDLDGAYFDKIAYNATRHDHSDAGRLAPGGKQF